MFHRRLVLLGAAAVVLTTGLSAQLVRLSVVEGAENYARAEKRLDRRTILPTWRGSVLDRTGRVLAEDRASYDVAVEYSVITGEWAVRRTGKQARREVGPTLWDQMSPDQRQTAIERHMNRWDGRINQLWATIRRLGGIDQAELDQRLDSIRRRVHRMEAAVYAARRRALQRQLHEQPQTIGRTTIRREPILEETEAHVVLPRVSDKVAFEFQKLADRWPEMIEVQDSTRRVYPWSTREVVLDRSTLPRPIRTDTPARIKIVGIGDHILGSMRDSVPPGLMKEQPFSDQTGEIVRRDGYRPGDEVGNRGLEATYENHLRGKRGVIYKRIDTGETRRTEPQPGETLHLTLDIELQTAVQAIMSPAFGLTQVQQWQRGWNRDGSPREGGLPLGWALNSAAVVIEIDSGDILAMVSMPTIARGEQMSKQQRAIAHPFIHRAVESPYPPGSIIKPLVLAAAVGEGVHDLGEKIECTGHYFKDRKDIARCWIYRAAYGYTTHTAQTGGGLGAVQAIARSCNIYFYTLGDALGLRQLTKWFQRFGMGSPLNIGLLHKENGSSVGEHGGMLPDEQTISRLEETGAARPNSIFMAIGQGQVAWTLVQAANAYATLARGGVIRDAQLIADEARGSLDESRRSGDLNISPRVIHDALEGLGKSVVEPYGTSHHIRYADRTTDPIINVEGVRVWAKTGTAQAPPLRIEDTNDDGTIDSQDEGLDDLDHAWFVGLAGPDEGEMSRPRYAIAVVVEYGGSGGRTAGPVANQIIRAMDDMGYFQESQQ